MKIHEKEKVIKFLDWLIEDIENVEYFNIKKFVNKYKDISEHEKSYLPFSIESIGKTYDLFENTLNSDEWFKLTIKGIKLKESGKTFNDFEKSLKPKWYNENWVGYIIAFITLIFAFYQGYQNHTLKDDISYLEKRVDSLKVLIPVQDKKYDSLNIQYDSLEKKLSDLKTKTEQKK